MLHRTYSFFGAVRAALPLVLSVVVVDAASALQVSERDSVRLLAQAQSRVENHIESVRPVTPRSATRAAESRPEVIALLDEIAARIPGDDWIAGHRVGLRVKHGQLAGAIEVALSCRAAPWWCAALSGFALHVAGRYVEAGLAFDEALRQMPVEQRCDWLGDVRRHLLSGGGRRMFGADCRDMISAETRLWWLADPLYLLPGNDRRTEHYSRMVAMKLHHDYLHLDGGTCRDTHHEAQVKQGWPEWWWSAEKSITDLRAGPGYRFVPRGNAAVRPLESALTDWAIAPSAYEERYDPSYGPVVELEQQTAFFLRGDSIAVVAAAELDPSLFPAGAAEVGLVLSTDELTPPLVERSKPESGHVVFQTRVPRSRYLVSVEALTREDGVGRSRFGHRSPADPDAAPGLSDLLLWDWREDVAQELDAVAPHAIGTTKISATRRLGLYWEVYGLSPGEALSVSVRAVPREAGLLRKIGERLRLVDPRESLRFVWEEGSREDGSEWVGRTLALDLSGLTPDRYVLELTVETDDGTTASVSRQIELTRQPASSSR